MKTTRWLMFFWLMSILGVSAETTPLAVGATMPDITVPGHDGKPVSLKTAAAQGYTLVYFYPKADTPGCTAQACSLRDAYAALEGRGVRIYGVSGDGVEAQAKFREKYDLPFTLLADRENKVIDSFGVPRVGAFAKRQAYLFKDGTLIWRDLKASTTEQAADILKILPGEEKTGG